MFAVAEKKHILQYLIHHEASFSVSFFFFLFSPLLNPISGGKEVYNVVSKREALLPSLYTHTLTLFLKLAPLWQLKICRL